MPEQNEIIENTVLADLVNRYRVYAPEIAKRRKPGQFVILRIDEDGERIPLTIADADPDAGTLTLVVQEVGKSTANLTRLDHANRRFAGRSGTRRRYAGQGVGNLGNHLPLAPARGQLFALHQRVVGGADVVLELLRQQGLFAGSGCSSTRSSLLTTALA